MSQVHMPRSTGRAGGVTLLAEDMGLEGRDVMGIQGSPINGLQLITEDRLCSRRHPVDCKKFTDVRVLDRSDRGSSCSSSRFDDIA